MFTSRPARPSLRGFSRSTTIVGAATAVAVGLSITGMSATTASALANPTVTLTVNGTTTSVTTAALTVDALLAERDVAYDGNDIVRPGTSTAITDGLTVNVRSAISVAVVRDGERVRKIVTAQTAAGVRRELGLPTKPETRQRRYDNYGFKRSRIYGPQGNLRTGNERVYEGSVAVVEAVRVAFPEANYRIKHRVVKDRSPLVRAGSVRVEQKGRDGKRHVVWRKRYVDQELVAKRVASAEVTREAKRRVVRVGTGPNWIALANCESGGNPNAVNPSGFYGLYQFSLSTWHAVGGKGNPTDYGYWEQTKRAWILYKSSGRSPWPVCGRYL